MPPRSPLPIADNRVLTSRVQRVVRNQEMPLFKHPSSQMGEQPLTRGNTLRWPQIPEGLITFPEVVALETRPQSHGLSWGLYQGCCWVSPPVLHPCVPSLVGRKRPSVKATHSLAFSLRPQLPRITCFRNPEPPPGKGPSHDKPPSPRGTEGLTDH